MEMLKNVLIFGAGVSAGAALAWAGSNLSRGEQAVSRLYWTYPVVAVLSGILYLLLFAMERDFREWLPGLVLVSVLTVLAVTDLKYRLLPDVIVYPAMLFFAVWRFFHHPLPLWQYALGFLIGGGVLYLISWIAVKMNKPPMGGGDIKLMAMLGLALGAEQVVLLLLVSSLLGVVSGYIMIAFRRIGKGGFVPFGPSIAAAALFCWFFGQALLSWYYGFFF